MRSVHIRDIPLPTLEALRRRARIHHRSLQAELLDILERAARQAPKAEGEVVLPLHFVVTGRKEPLSREDLYGYEGR